jgi:hypothetical protein
MERMTSETFGVVISKKRERERFSGNQDSPVVPFIYIQFFIHTYIHTHTYIYIIYVSCVLVCMYARILYIYTYIFTTTTTDGSLMPVPLS